MKVLSSSGPYRVRIGPGVSAQLGPALLELGLRGKVALISDDDVFHLHALAPMGSLEEAKLPCLPIRIPPGEASKTLARADWLYGRLIEGGIGRDDTVVALGGGVVGDLAGFVAATYHRGVAFVQLPTTLLSQVDSSVGGKVAVDHPLGKNLVGAFYPPRTVLADTDTLATLPPRERWSGLAEVVKAAFVADADFLPILEEQLERLAEPSPPAGLLAEAIARSVRIKAAVVEADEHEGGLRRILNFGHTIGHALELATGFGVLTHGEAVVMGMRAALFVSVELGTLAAPEAERATRLLARFPAPPPFRAPSPEAVIAGLQRDKKADRFVVLSALGKAEVVRGLEPRLLRRAIDKAYEGLI
ncbi:3-dehydroquinate synthase [Vulgatibacter incomptus]|uniref:3-dehydroquinate synthase n=1 Tax=Vulgatibacter incomptus TaxID=1391653 RepID=UPI00068277DE|nr:3-dehydroquinate synthase [Vulgatibacter incomptus]